MQSDLAVTRQLPDPGAVVFAAAMRAVLRVRHDSQVDGPDAVEDWTRVGGFVWTWSARGGMWRVTAGALSDPRPLLHGPGGYWRVSAQLGELAAEQTVALLRAAGAVVGPLAPRAVHVREGSGAVVRGRWYPTPSVPDPLVAVLHRPSVPPPLVPAGYVALPTTSDRADADGCWGVRLPGGHVHRYDPARRRCMVPAGAAPPGIILFESGMTPDGRPPVRQNGAVGVA